jgi:peptidoglycan L-alanyl-D-glutamate endopeptidase CwlK
MPKFSVSSLSKLQSCHPTLQRLFERIVKHWDCTILCGYRDKEAQDEAFRLGRSTKEWPRSVHNKKPSKAVDVAPYHAELNPHIRWNDLQDFYYFSGFVIGYAKAMGVTLRHGGDWDRDKDINDQTFVDLPHFELVTEWDEA